MSHLQLEALLARHRAFWTMAEVDEPLERIGTYSPLAGRAPYPFADGALAREGSRFSPELIDPARHAGTGDGFDSPVGWPAGSTKAPSKLPLL